MPLYFYLLYIVGFISSWYLNCKYFKSGHGYLQAADVLILGLLNLFACPVVLPVFIMCLALNPKDFK